jgi:hypothetical protein
LAPWWLTSERIVGRLASGDLVGLQWARLIGCLIDLSRELVVLDGPNHRRYSFSGPATPVIAVVAVAQLHGIRALLSHKALSALRTA